jgi:hypothetical protein
MADAPQPLQPLPPAQPVQAVSPLPVPRTACHCAYCRIRSLFGPVMIITVGVLFLLAQYSRWSFGELWPFLLIVAGLMKVAEAMAPRDGHPAS